MDVEAWLEGLAPGCAVTGPALSRLTDRLPARATVLDREVWQPTAAAVGQVAWQSYSAGRRDDPFTLVPQYFRRTAAEEQWERKKQQ
jgi:tRNA threonylcarbamoyladenosine biosynthesis protein TsaB